MAVKVDKLIDGGKTIANKHAKAFKDRHGGRSLADMLVWLIQCFVNGPKLPPGKLYFVLIDFLQELFGINYLFDVLGIENVAAAAADEGPPEPVNKRPGKLD